MQEHETLNNFYKNKKKYKNCCKKILETTKTQCTSYFNEKDSKQIDGDIARSDRFSPSSQDAIMDTIRVVVFQPQQGYKKSMTQILSTLLGLCKEYVACLLFYIFLSNPILKDIIYTAMCDKSFENTIYEKMKANGTAEQ